MNQEPLPNMRLSRYRLVSKIGTGGMGEVYLAEDERLRRKIALKVLPESLAQDKDRLQRFEQEALAASALNQPNILTIYEFGAEGATHYLASEFIDGETLRDRLERSPLSVNEAIDIAVQTAQALAAAHEANIVHRDIKPENVMVRKDSIVKVLDFGLAKLAEGQGDESLTLPGTVMGTVAYMSPEQARGLTVDARTDLFSLGVMLYEMLSRRQPFMGETVSHVIIAILEQEPPPLTGIPAELTRILARALAKRAEERYESAQAMLADLKKLQTRLLVEAENKRNSADDRPVEAQTLIEPQLTVAAPVLSATASANPSSTLPAHSKPWRWWLTAGLGLLLTVGGYFGYRSFTLTKQIESIAVMPFVNEGKNEDVEYLSDGITETLITSLSNLPNLNVKPRSTVFRYKGKEASPQAIAKELNVGAILTGKLVQRGQDVSLFIELIDVALDKVVWSQQYNRKQSDLVSLQSEVARTVSSKLKSQLSNAVVAKIEKNYRVNAEAYELYLKGLFQYNRLTANSLTQAAEYFKQSIEKDPNYAPAYVGLGKTLWSFPLWSLAAPKEIHPQMKAAALKAMALDDSLPGIHELLGGYLRDLEWDWVGAEREFRRAIELDPNNVYAYESLAWLFAYQKKFNEAITAGRRGNELDPRSPRTPVIQVLIWSRRYDEAIAELNEVRPLDPNYADTYWRLGTAYYGKGSYQEAIASFQKYLELDDDPVTRAYLALAKAKAGSRDEAVKLLNWLKQESSKRYITGTAFAITYLALGQKDEAYKWLEKEVDDRSGWAVWYGVAAALDELREEPRFKAMLKRMNLPE